MLHHLPSSAAQDRLFAEAARVLQGGGPFAGTDSRTDELPGLVDDLLTTILMVGTGAQGRARRR